MALRELSSLSAARRSERNILAKLEQYEATNQLYQELWRQRKTIEAIVAHHLRFSEPRACIVQGMDSWIKGQFNICVVVHVDTGEGKNFKKIFRCPMAHKVGEKYSSGAVEEKMRAEIGAYAWIESNCPDIPIPRLEGFGLLNDLQFTRHRQGPGYIRDLCRLDFSHPYLVLEYIDSKQGRMLSATLSRFRETDAHRMQNLFRGISQAMLSLARRTHPSIGSLRFNDDGTTTLSTRPMLCTLAILESEGAPPVVDRTFTASGTFIDYMLRFREEAFRAQPNAVNDEEDCHLQMHHMVLMRMLKHHFVSSQVEEPFVLQFTDLHASNIFVDDQWNVVALIDFEFVCALPCSMMSVPHWLSVDAIDEVIEHQEKFCKMHRAFMDCFREEERKVGHRNQVKLATTIQQAWDSRAYWYHLGLTSINGMVSCVEDHLYAKFGVEPSVEEEKVWVKTMSSFWSLDSKKDVEQKVCDKANYNADLARYFEGRLN